MIESFLLSVQLAAAIGATADSPATPDDMVAQAQAQNATIQIGTPVNGELSPSDTTLNSGEFADYYEFEGETGDRLEISMSSQAFDTYLGLTSLQTNATVPFAHANDDAPGRGNNSQLVVTLPGTGTYRIQATSYAAGEQGAYSLSVVPFTGGGLGARTSTPTTIPNGQPATGRLEAGDTTLNSGEFTDTYVYNGTAGETINVALSSNEFDPYLMLRGPGGTSLDNDDLAEGNYNSGITATLPETGAYRLIATSYAPNETGAYTLTVDTQGRAATQRTSTLIPGQPATGNLAPGLPHRGDGEHYQEWSFQGTAGESITLDMTSDAFDTYLELTMPNGAQQFNDDIERLNTNSRINATLPANGTYTVRASSYAPGEVGQYRLSLAAATSAQPQPTQQQPQTELTGDTISFGQALDGRLARRDPQLTSGEYYDTISFQGSAGQGLTINLESSQFDTYVMLRGPGDTSFDNDDGPGGGTDSRIEASLPADGVYSILVTSYAPGEQGRYTLTLEEGTTVEQNASGRVYAILAGITDYADANDLPFCAEDAVRLGDSIGATGIMADESIVLTDEQVTVANLERAFLSVASQAGPDDVFIFFYSGHGAHIDNRQELDGRDETIYVFDGHITDDQVAGWFDSVNARLSIIALDSCFSGGFARDVISAPNRMGIFSSEEDVTSNVAARFQAGGYLSYFLRNAISGDADAEPRDGIITAGELSQYLHRQWAANNMVNESTETTDAALAYQNLVIDRGSVKVTDVVVYNR